jgi:TolA-binding protein
MKKAKTAAAILVVLLGTAMILQAQSQSSETARKHLESGIQFFEQAMYKQGLNDFEIVVSMADPEYADDALLRIGEYYLEVEGDFATARDYFDQVLQGYPTKDAAPGAYYYIGLVTLRSGFGAAAIDDALANFQRVVKLYPQSEWVPAALHSTGTALERRAAWTEALDSYFRVVSEYPDSRWAAGSQLAMGRCTVRLGKPFEGMLGIQKVRSRYPGSVEAVAALDWLTLMFRFYGYPQLGRPVAYRVDSSFRTAMADKFKDVEAVRVSTRGVHLLERGKKRVLTFERTGKLAGTKAAADPRGLFIDAEGMIVVANEKGLLMGERPFVLAVPEEKGPKPLDKIRVAVRDRLGDVYVYDDKQKKVLRFDSEGTLKGSFPDATPRKVLRLELDKLGNVILLDEDDRSVSVYTPAGRRVARMERKGRQWNMERPTDIAVDPAGYFYILDERQPQVVVYDPSYNFVAVLTAQNLGGGVLKKPISLDVDGSGDIYVYDDDAKSLIRFH